MPGHTTPVLHRTQSQALLPKFKTLIVNIFNNTQYRVMRGEWTNPLLAPLNAPVKERKASQIKEETRKDMEERRV
jgi:hypothetical protein